MSGKSTSSNNARLVNVMPAMFSSSSMRFLTKPTSPMGPTLAPSRCPDQVPGTREQPKGVANTKSSFTAKAPRLVVKLKMANSTPVTPKPKSAPKVKPLNVTLTTRLDWKSMKNLTASVWLPSGLRVMWMSKLPVTSALETAAIPLNSKNARRTERTLLDMSTSLKGQYRGQKDLNQLSKGISKYFLFLDSLGARILAQILIHVNRIEMAGQC